MAAFDKIALGQYIPAKSPIHALDPRAKIILVISAMAAVFMTHTLTAFILWGALLLLIARLSRIPPRVVAASARPVLILIIFTSLLHLFLTPGDEIARFGRLAITKEGVFLALTMSMRLACLVMYASLLTFTTSPSQISDGLEGLLSPLKRVGVPAHEIAMMITIALRFIPTLFEETGRIIKAQKSRGAEFDEGSLMKRAKAYIPVLIPLFVIIFKRAESLAVAMEARGYCGGAGRTRMKPLRWRPSASDALAARTEDSSLAGRSSRGWPRYSGHWKRRSPNSTAATLPSPARDALTPACTRGRRSVRSIWKGPGSRAACCLRSTRICRRASASCGPPPSPVISMPVSAPESVNTATLSGTRAQYIPI